MAGSDGGRPEFEHRASDPSLEEMLRRARDAPLGDSRLRDDGDRWRVPPIQSLYPARVPHGRLRDWILVSVGLLAGLLLALSVMQVTALVRSATSWTSPPAVTSTATLSPTPTVTPLPTPTSMPTATPEPYLPPPTSAEIVALAQGYYDNYGPFAGSYLLRDVTALQIDSQDGSQLTVCMAYEAATASTPDTLVGSNTRLFTLETANDGNWHVVQMGGPESCGLG